MGGSMGNFFSRLSYSFGNEDWRTEQKALRLKPGDRVVCITGSGDRPLNLLYADCGEIVSVDANPMQNYLLELKQAAIKELDYDDYLSFLGANPTANRLELYRKISPSLHLASQEFWNKHIPLIEKGILYQGMVERLCKTSAFFFNLFKKKDIEKLFLMDDMNEQRKFVDERWNSPLLRRIFEIALSPTLTRLFGIDPGLYENLPKGFHPGKYIFDRLYTCLHRSLAKEAPLISLVIRGKIDKPGYPPCMLPTGCHAIKQRLDRIKVEHDDIINYLETAPANSFNAFSLSDVSSYLDPERYQRLIKAVHRTARPGATFCLRQFLSEYTIPEEFQHSFARDSGLEELLQKEDRCFVYRFMAGNIVK
jgi:S-adenosylmethionine-diacylglycerol 3-amino-3-carboxypropyl transferase